jgi:SEC-C motif domain protein
VSKKNLHSAKGGAAAAQSTSPCPCGGRAIDARHKPAATYDQCCARFIDHDDIPATAEQLMRSRYTAYVLERFDYLRQTWDAATCPSDLGSEPGPQWLGLDVKRYEPVDATHAKVEFVARYKVGGRAHRIHETSHFLRSEDGRWRYVDGDVSES